LLALRRLQAGVSPLIARFSAGKMLVELARDFLKKFRPISGRLEANWEL